MSLTIAPQLYFLRVFHQLTPINICSHNDANDVHTEFDYLFRVMRRMLPLIFLVILLDSELFSWTFVVSGKRG